MISSSRSSTKKSNSYIVRRWTYSHSLLLSNCFDSRRNILPFFTNYYISTCRYHRQKNPVCPTFTVGDILQHAEADLKEAELMILKVWVLQDYIMPNLSFIANLKVLSYGIFKCSPFQGGVIEIMISWNCHYDFFSEKCLPVYNFRRFDAQFKQKAASSGFNFRYNEFLFIYLKNFLDSLFRLSKCKASRTSTYWMALSIARS